MIRVRAVRHPSEWAFCGYNEILAPPQRHTLIDRKQMMALVGIDSSEIFGKKFKRWVDAILERGNKVRENKWTQSIAVGGKDFVEMLKDRLGCKAVGRKV